MVVPEVLAIKSAHTGQLTDLVDGTTGAGVCHHKDGVILVQSCLSARRYTFLVVSSQVLITWS